MIKPYRGGIVGWFSSNTSSMRCSVSSPDVTLRTQRVENTTRCGLFFDELQGVSSGNETLWQMLDTTSQTKWF